MPSTLRSFLVLLFLAIASHATAQDYAATLNELRNQKSTDAMNQHNLPLYLKLAHEEYDLTSRHYDTLGMIRAYVKLVDYYTNIRLNNDSANLYRNKGLYWARLNKNIEYEADLRYMQAAQYVANGKYVEAYALYQSLDSVVLANNFDFAPFYNKSYAELLLFLKEKKKAIVRMQMAASGFEKQQDPQSVAVVYVNVAGQYFQLGRTDSTFFYLNKALKINQSLKDTVAIAECYTRFGLVYAKEGQPEKARTYYKLAFDLNPANPSNQLVTNYTEVLISEGKFEEAEHLLFDLKKTENVVTQLSALKSLIRLRESEGRYKDALALSEEYNEKNQELLDVEKIRQIEELQTQYDVAEKENQINLLHERNEHQAKTLFKNRIILYISLGLFLMVLLTVFLMFRNKAIRLKAEQILLERQLLRSQMNPHFIFNCLSNIQSTVLQKEHIKAASYIATFSKLVRNILENSTQSHVTFSNELTTLNDYLVLQKIRYNDRFDYEITVDEEIEEDMVSIPPMLFQPIVENAIEHGIVEKTDGFINIHFQQHDNYIHCTVIDNGVGYGNNINVSKSESANKKVSLSTQITKRRLVILSKYLKQTLDYKITVLNNEKGEAAGTKVEIDIPILS
ncbi:tetratricopeptide repeat protein [Taibaiella lutea]|uniref:Tetratricopeptide repeat protein n=1 Tax=Taibaiella lutea TaxID=2608001 RepID=A0A5M6CKG3_9BACT|nr:histidine kinase [Taibaiella lutea]KAA5534920.1 tetratricopeptide repeat protein [Taibaiella lutea]